ncbi:MAG TPA: Barstar (barnase inhibitor) [Bacteroidia bacterium]|nr:Barstar (barnase inhibitor) [Bacteroidia bacterium]
MKKTITLNANNFSDLAGFCNELKNLMVKSDEFKIDARLHLINDILCGGLGVHNYKEPITLVWQNSQKSQADLDFPSTIKHTEDSHFTNPQLQAPAPKKVQPLFNVLVDIIQAQHHIELVLA